MFENWKFRRLFGFAPPAKYTIDFAAEKIVAIRLAALEAIADARKATAEALEQEIRDLLVEPRQIIIKRSAWLAAQKTYRTEEAVLRDACHVAVEYGFHPVARYQILWERAQEREAKARQARFDKRAPRHA